jgi:hypothetical protein
MPVISPNEWVSIAVPWTSPYAVDLAFPFHLVNREGQHLFILNRTAWGYFGCRDPRAVLERARQTGCNVLRVALEGAPYFDSLGIELWPWGGSRQAPDWTTFNEPYWQQVEARIRLAGEYGIGLDLVLYMALHPGQAEIQQHQPYWERAITQLGRYANLLTWEIANEYTANEVFQDAAGRFFKSNDPVGRPVCSSDGTTDDALWPEKDWIDLAINHTCTSSSTRHDLHDWYLALARNTRAHGKPAFCNESGREVRHKNDDPLHRRKQGWLWCAAGAFWTFHSWDGCEGIDTFMEQDYHAPGEEFLRPMADFFRLQPFWRLSPNYTAFSIQNQHLTHTALATPDRSLIIAYLAALLSGTRLTGCEAGLRLPDGLYRVICYQPADLSVLSDQVISAPGLRQSETLALPEFCDDLLVEVRRVAAADRSIIPDTQ